jgi:hypothetical protein
MQNFTRVDYKGIIADILEPHLQDAVDILQAESATGREAIIQSVTRALDEMLEIIAKNPQKITEQMRRNTANDIGLWFANEIIEGRADNYKTSIQ